MISEQIKDLNQVQPVPIPLKKEFGAFIPLSKLQWTEKWAEVQKKLSSDEMSECAYCCIFI